MAKTTFPKYPESAFSGSDGDLIADASDLGLTVFPPAIVLVDGNVFTLFLHKETVHHDPDGDCKSFVYRSAVGRRAVIVND